MAPLAPAVLPGWRSLVTRGQSASRSGSATRDRSGKSARDPMGRVGSNPAGRKPPPEERQTRAKIPPPAPKKTVATLFGEKKGGTSSDLRRAGLVRRGA